MDMDHGEHRPCEILLGRNRAFVCKEAYYISKLFVWEFEMNFTDVIPRQYRDGTTRIRFDLDVDTLVINHIGITASEERDANEVDH